MKSYALPEPLLSRAVAACVKVPAFWRRIGKDIDPDHLSAPWAAATLRVVRLLADEGPVSDPSLVAAFAEVSAKLGNVSREDAWLAQDWLELAAPSIDPGDPDELAAAVLPAVRSVAMADTADAVVQVFGRGGTVEEVQQALSAVAGLGAPDAAPPAVKFDPARLASWEAFVGQFRYAAQRTGIPWLDCELTVRDKEGLERAGLGMFIGRSGAGKSTCLAHVASSAALVGHRVLYVTLEESAHMIRASIVCNMLHLLEHKLQDGLYTPAFMDQRWSELVAHLATVGYAPVSPIVVEMDGSDTSAADLEARLKELRFPGGEMADTIVVDYLDMMVPSLRKLAKSANSNDLQGAAAAQLRALAKKHDLWAWTASQARRRSSKQGQASRDKRKVRDNLEMDDVADSKKKVDKVDLAVSINRPDGEEEGTATGLVWFKVVKRRNGPSGKITTAEPTDIEHGRIVHVHRDEPAHWKEDD